MSQRAVQGPSPKAVKEQNLNLRAEVEQLRHFLKGDARLSFHLWVLWRADAWRHRHRADAFAAQLRAAGITAQEPSIPPLPAPKDEDDRAIGRWFAQAKTSDEGEAA